MELVGNLLPILKVDYLPTLISYRSLRSLQDDKKGGRVTLHCTHPTLLKTNPKL
jgi:hypothetical protein